MADSKTNWVKIIGAVIGIIAGVAIANAPVPEGLTVKAMWGMGIFAWAVIWWMVDVVSDYATTLMMLATYAGLNVVPFTTAFASFNGPTVWLIVAALAYGAAAAKSGLLKRVALMAMSKFPITFKGQSLALFAAGLVITPLIPTATAKVAVIAPFAQAICDNMGYEKKSPGAVGLFLAMFVSLVPSYSLFLSANFMCYAVLGFLPKDVQAQMTWTNWLINALPWGLTMLILSYLAIIYLYRPPQTNKVNPAFISEQLAALGSMTRNEKLVAVVLGISLILWMTEKVHGVSSTMVALVGTFIMLMFNVLDRASFRSAIPWDAVIFLGGLFNVPVIFGALKINAWISKVFGPYIAPLASGNIFVFIIALCLLVFVVRIFLVSQTAVIAILVILLTPFVTQAGISPWIPAFIIFVAGNTWCVPYQNAGFLVSYYATGGDMVTHGQTLKLAFVYMVTTVIGLLLSVPVWKMTGLIQ